MDFLPWSLVLLSGIIHALWNLKVKQVDNRLLFLALAYVFAAVFMLPPTVGMNLFFIPEKALLPVVLSAAAEALYVITLSKAYARYELTFVYPIARGSAPIWATAAGAAFFSEELSAAGALGIAAIIAGILIIGFRKGNESFRAMFLSLLLGFLVAAYSSLDRLAIEYTAVYNLLFWKFLFAGITLLLIQANQKDLAASIKKNLKMSAATGLFILAAYFLVVLAMKYANLGYVTVGRESGIGFACLFGALFLKEEIGRVKLAGILVLFSGIVILRFA